MHSFLKLSLVLAFAFGTVACGGPITVIKRPAAKAISGHKTIGFGKVTYKDLTVGEKSEQAYLSGKKSGSSDKWNKNKETWKKDFSGILALQLKANGVQLKGPGSQINFKVNIEFIEPGYNIGISSKPAVIRARVQVFDKKSKEKPLYIFTVKTSAGGYTTGGRIREAMLEVAQHTARFLAKELR